MRITAAVAVYAEPPAFMQRLMSSLSGVVDRVEILMGRWALMPGDGRPAWPSQVAKRDALMSNAAAGADWVLVIDGDEYIEEVNARALRIALELTNAEAATVTLRTLNRPWPYRHLAPMQTTAPRLFRAGTRVTGPAHNDYTFNGRPPRLADMTGLVTIAHDNRARPRDRDRAAQEYRAARRRERVEVAA